MQRPEPHEYASYYRGYVGLVPDGNPVDVLAQQMEETLDLLESISEEKGDDRYAEGKWSIKEVVGHMIDTERIFAYRALCFSRNEKAPLPGYEQDDYVTNANFGERTLADLIDEFRALRVSNVSFFKRLSEDMWQRKGVANGVEMTVRAILYIIMGHELHHVEVLKERYLGES